MNSLTSKCIKCAIYTRKSSEEGLEQDFNSLDAQREACEAYIKSQQGEGWILVNKKYDDGGFSGGTLDRPAFKELFLDIESGEVNIVVVYKVDRLTRSLIDFAKIVELFDNNSASFVSITQHFNTTTSMGRLTLNILLSFAQFEREVTGERIRDKIAASKKKGMWMSGSAPIGYILQEKKLVIEEISAQKVKTIFNKYLKIRSVPKLKQYLDKNKVKTSAGMSFSKGHLYSILTNKTYIGLISHKTNTYEGEHESIIDRELFDRVQKLLSKNKVSNTSSIKCQNPSLLAGKIFDDKGNYMSPSHSNTRNRRYRYYVSQALIQSRRHEAGTISKIPAGEIEALTRNVIKDFLFDSNNLQSLLKNYDLNKQKDLLSTLNKIQTSLNDFINDLLIRTVLHKVIVYKEKVDIIICTKQLIKVVDSITYNTPYLQDSKNTTKDLLTISKDIRISSTSKNGSVLIISDSKLQEANINQHLVKAIVKSYHWNKLLISGEFNSIKEIQKNEKLSSDTYVKKVVHLRFLAPEIVEKILNGSQPRDLTVQKLFEVKTLDWDEQKKILNF